MGFNSPFNQGLIGGLSALTSGSKRGVPSTEFMFGPGSVGGAYGRYLRDLYRTPVDQTPQYLSESTALRDALSQEQTAGNEQLGLATNAGGYFDSGARIATLAEANRGRMAAYSKGLSEILSNLENQKLQAAFPFLQARLGAYSGYQNALGTAEGAQNQRYGINNQTFTSLVGDFTHLAGGGGGLG